MTSQLIYYLDFAHNLTTFKPVLSIKLANWSTAILEGAQTNIFYFVIFESK